MSGRIKVPWAATVLIAVATASSLLAYADPVSLGAWLIPSLVLMAAVTGTVLVTRLVSRSRLLPTGLGIAVAVAALVPLHTDAPFPTPGGLRALASAVRDGATYAATSVAPVDDAAPLAALVSVALVALFLLAEHVSVSWRATGIAGAFLLLPWLPAAIVPWSVPWQAVVVALASWLGALALTSMHEDVPAPPRVVAWAPAVVATILVAAMLTPFAIGAPGWGRLPQAQIGGDAATRLDLGLDLRESLNSRSNSVVLRYTSDGSGTDVLRLYTAEEFTGSSWRRADSAEDSSAVSAGVLWPEPALLTDEPGTTLEISIDTLQQDALPITVDPRRVYVSDDWTYDSVRDEVVSTTTDTGGMDYTIVTDPDYITVERLQSAPALSGEHPEALALADSIDVEGIGALAEQLVTAAGAQTEYDKALAIQQWLRDPTEFRYDTTVALQGDDAVSEFLSTRQGYCVQFATTMVVMARTLGIPARIGVGFLGGERSSGSTFAVVGGNAHAWPELYFPDTGWVRFEPTPAVQASAPSYAEGSESGATPTPSPSSSSTSDPTPSPSDDPSTNASPSASPSASAEGVGRAGTGAAGGLVWLVALLAAGGAAGGAWMLIRRRRGPLAPSQGAEAAWSRLRDRLVVEARWPLSATPFEAAAHVRAHASLTLEADEALSELTDTVTSLRYVPADPDAEPASSDVHRLRELADAVVEGARRPVKD